MITAVLAAGGLAGELQAREVPFAEPPAISTTADGAWSVFAADVDGDGHLDALSASAYDDKIAWYENTNGDGSSWTTHTITTSADGAKSVFAADVDGDGDTDALSVNSVAGYNSIAWYENKNPGDGSSWAKHTITTNANGAYSVFATDVDGDGDTDALSASFSDDKIAWYENDGAGGSWTLHTISTTADGAFSVYAGDVDGDGDLDALSASRNDDKIAWYERGFFPSIHWDVHTISATADDARSVFAADLDGDGDLDALSASNDDNKIAWYENAAGDGLSWTTHTITTSAYRPRSVFAADVDGDGDIDALSASVLDDKIAWYENTAGDGTSWSIHTIKTSANGALSVFAADVDGDGDRDALSASFYDDKIAWYRNDTIHRSAEYPDRNVIAANVNAARSVFSTDVDGDGDLDALSVSPYGDRVDWHENGGSGATWTRHTIGTGVGGAADVFAADLDGDGDTDTIAAAYGGVACDDSLAWFENDGSGGNWTPHCIANEDNFTLSVVAADVEADGDLDVLAASGADDRIAWFENDGTGGGWTLHTITTAADAAFAVFAADVDGDGDLDALSASTNDDTIRWYENIGGGGSSWGLRTITTVADQPFSLFAVDMDGDGDPDALSASAYDDTVAWYENPGTTLGTWTQHKVTVAADNAYDAVPADFDGDGDLDVIAASKDDDKVAWHENDGTGDGWSAHVITTMADGAAAVWAADVDSDGDLDALSASRLDDTIAWYENRGGQFGLPTLDLAQKVVGNGETHDLLDIQAIHRGRAGDSDAELVTLELELTDEADVPYTSAEANDIIKEMRIYLDDGSGEFEESADTLVDTVFSFNLTNGVETVTFSDGNTNVQLPFGAPKVYFIVVEMQGDAESQFPHKFQIDHLIEASSTGEDRPNDIPLTLEFWPDTGTGVVDTTLDSTSCEAPFDLQLADRTVTTTVDCQAGTFIRAGTDFTVGSGGDLSLRAGETVRFTSGFHVDTGTLTVNIDPGLKP